MSSKTTGDMRWALLLTATIRAPPAATGASYNPSTSSKCPRWLVANCRSQPRSVNSNDGNVMAAALFTRMWSGPSHAAMKARTLPESVSSSGSTATSGLPVVATMSAATRPPASVFRTASVTRAPAAASARAALDADARRRAGDDHAPAGQVDALDHLEGRRVVIEGGGDQVAHAADPTLAALAKVGQYVFASDEISSSDSATLSSSRVGPMRSATGCSTSASNP